MNNYPVLLFHSIDDRDLSSLKDLGNISPELFEKFIVRLKEEFDIIDLDELARCISGSIAPKDRLLAITFDDGPKSYITKAMPVMEVYNVPSTCFLITDCVDDRHIYWRYLYNYCINRGFAYELAALINIEYRTDIMASDIISFSREHYDMKKNDCIIGKLLNNVIPEKIYREQERELFLSMDDIGKLKQDPLVRLGIHTRSHPVLKGLSDEEIRDEIAGSLNFYQSRIGEDVPMLSLPFGRPFVDYDERTIAIANTLSINIILSAYGGGNAIGQPLYNVRRISVHEDDLKDGLGEFIMKLQSPDLPPDFIGKEKELSRRLFLK